MDRTSSLYCWVVYLTDDAMYLGPDQPAVVGKANILEFVEGFFKDWRFDFPEWITEEVTVAGNIALHRYSGTATVTPKNGGDRFAEDHRYLGITRKEPDGHWRLSRHMYNLSR